MPNEAWNNELRALHNDIRSTAIANLQLVVKLKSELKSQNLKKQLHSSFIHAQLAERAAELFVQDLIERIVEPPDKGPLSAQMAKLHSMQTASVTERLRVFTRLSLGSDLDGFYALAQFLFNMITQQMPIAMALDLLNGIRGLMTAIDCSTDELDKGFLKWEAFDLMIFESAVWTALEVEALTSPPDDNSPLKSLDVLAREGMARAVRRVENIFQEFRSVYPEEIWVPVAHGGSLLTRAFASSPT